MKAAILYGKEDVRLEEVPTPRAEPGEVLIQIRSALTCGTDLKVFRNGSHAKMLKPPILFGHEYSGVIHEVGTGVASWKPGMRVVGANSAPCRTCFYCRRGQPNLCEDLLFVNGAYAEYLRVPARIVKENLLEIPPSLTFEKAALTEPLACALRGIQAVRPQKGETAVILGAGPVGLFFVQLAARAGARVVLVGKGALRLEKGAQCGAGTVLDLAAVPDPAAAIRETTEGKGADLCIEAVGRPAAWSQAVDLVRPGGRVLFFGGCPAGTQIPLDTRRMHYDELTLLSTFHHTPDAIRESLRLLASGEVDSAPLITGSAPLDELPRILRRMLTAQDAVKTAIIP